MKPVFPTLLPSPKVSWGSWHLVKIRYGSNGQIVVPDKNITVTFGADTTYTISENAAVIAQGSSKIKKGTADTWEFDENTVSQYLDGYIAVCGDRVLFSNNWLDGNDNLFEKVN